MIVEWNQIKAERNLRKHGISFEEAATAFEDPFSITIPDPDHSVGEQRYLLLGRTARGSIIVVAHTERGDNIRIINARRADRREKRKYAEG